MNKVIIIIGQANSGKTYLAKNAALLFSSVCWIDGKQKNLFDYPFTFSETKKDTDLLVFDDVSSIETIRDIVFFDEIKIEKRGMKAISIKKPLTIITTDVKLPLDFFYSASHTRRCSIIKSEIASNGIFNYSKHFN